MRAWFLAAAATLLGAIAARAQTVEPISRATAPGAGASVVTVPRVDARPASPASSSTGPWTAGPPRSAPTCSCGTPRPRSTSA
jgi:hypothetical protein